jgi:hypothetical protein
VLGFDDVSVGREPMTEQSLDGLLSPSDGEVTESALHRFGARLTSSSL